MKKTLLLFFCLQSILSFSQIASFTSGPKFKSKNGDFKYILGETETSFYVLRTGTKGAGVQNNIEKYNKQNFELEWVKDASFESDLQGRIPSNDQLLHSYVTLVKDKIYFIISMVETRKNSRSVYAKALSASNGESLGAAQLLAKQDDYGGLFPLQLDFSRDKQKILIINYALSEMKLVEMLNFKEVFTKKIPEQTGNDAISVTSLDVDDDGNVLCIYEHTIKENGKIVEKHPGIGKIPVNSNQLLAFDLKFNVAHAEIKSSLLQYEKNYNYAIVTGFFVDDPCKRDKTCVQKEGNFYMKIDLNNKKIVNTKVDYFDEELHTYYTSLFDYYNDGSRLNEIASYISKNEEVYTIAKGDMKTIFVTHYSKEGKLLWRTPIPFSPWQGVGHFAYDFKNDNVYLIYLENEKNLELDLTHFDPKKLKETKYPKRSDIVAVRITKDGVATREVIGNNKEQDLLIDFYFYEQSIPNSGILHLSENIKDEKFIRFDLK